MSSEFQALAAQALADLQTGDYMSVIILTAVGYDYILIFSDEVEYIWTKRWTWVSTLYILVRYVGLCEIVWKYFYTWYRKAVCIFLCLVSVLHNIIQHLWNRQCQIMAIMQAWVSLLFLGAADFVMILRVWAMYNRSRVVLAVLLILFLCEIITAMTDIIMGGEPRKLVEVTVPVLNLPICQWYWGSSTGPIMGLVVSSIEIVHGAALCIFAMAQFAIQAVQMYRITKQWQLSRYISMFVRQGILYFLCNFLVVIFTVVGDIGKTPSGGWQLLIFGMTAYMPMFILTPRFFLSIRVLYARDSRGGGGREIDSGFGLSFSHDVGRSAIVFADVQQNKETEDIEEVLVPRQGETTRPE